MQTHAPPPTVAFLTARTRRSWPLAARWLLAALAFPPAGELAILAVNAVDAPAPALVGGFIAGAGLGAAQWLALRSLPGGGARLRNRWIAGTASAMAVGLALGAALVGYRTGTGDLVAMGLATGAVLGPVQAAVATTTGVLDRRSAALWAATVPALWSLGWWITASAGIDVERQFAVFGISGALATAAVGGAVLGRLVRRSNP